MERSPFWRVRALQSLELGGHTRASKQNTVLGSYLRFGVSFVRPHTHSLGIYQARLLRPQPFGLFDVGIRSLMANHTGRFGEAPLTGCRARSCEQRQPAGSSSTGDSATTQPLKKQLGRRKGKLAIRGPPQGQACALDRPDHSLGAPPRNPGTLSHSQGGRGRRGSVGSQGPHPAEGGSEATPHTDTGGRLKPSVSFASLGQGRSRALGTGPRSQQM